MAKGNDVETLQKARIAEWAGDITYALEQYELFLKKQTPALDFKKFMEPSLRTKIDNLGSEYANQLKNDDKSPAYWRYNVLGIGQTGNLLNLEIRGFDPLWRIPNLEKPIPKRPKRHRILKMGFEYGMAKSSSGDQQRIDMIWFSKYVPDTETTIYLTLDCWGIVYGEIVVPEQHFQATMEQEIQVLLQEMGSFYME